MTFNDNSPFLSIAPCAAYRCLGNPLTIVDQRFAQQMICNS